MNVDEAKELIADLLEDLELSRSVEDVSEVESDIRNLLANHSFEENYVASIEARMTTLLARAAQLPSRQHLLNKSASAQRLQLLRRLAPECKNHPGEPMLLQESMDEAGNVKSRFWGCKFYGGSSAKSCFFKRPLTRLQKEFLEGLISYDQITEATKSRSSNVPVQIESRSQDNVVAQDSLHSDSGTRNYAAEFLARLLDHLDPFTGGPLARDSIWLHPTVQNDIARVLAIHSVLTDSITDELPNDEVIADVVESNKLKKLSEIFEKVPLIQIFSHLKLRHPNSRVLIQNGCYHEVFSEDARFFSEKFGWKLFERAPNVLVTGFPTNSRNVWKVLRDDKVPFIVVSQLPASDDNEMQIVRRTVTEMFNPEVSKANH